MVTVMSRSNPSAGGLLAFARGSGEEASRTGARGLRGRNP